MGQRQVHLHSPPPDLATALKFLQLLLPVSVRGLAAGRTARKPGRVAAEPVDWEDCCCSGRPTAEPGRAAAEPVGLGGLLLQWEACCRTWEGCCRACRTGMTAAEQNL